MCITASQLLQRWCLTASARCAAGYLSSGDIHHFLTDKVRLVPHQQPGDVLTGVAIYLVQPLLHIVKGLLWTEERRRQREEEGRS